MYVDNIISPESSGLVNAQSDVARLTFLLPILFILPIPVKNSSSPSPSRYLAVTRGMPHTGLIRGQAVNDGMYR